MLISPSQLAIEAAGILPEGTDIASAEHAGKSCAVCGTAIMAGEVIDALKLPISFTNHTALANPGGKWRCGACTAVMTRSDFQMAASTVLISRDGIYPIVRKEHRAWAFLTPPEPPFAIAIQNAKQQHVIWRAPVSLSKEMILIRVGEQIVRIRRSMLMGACAEARLLDERNRTQGRPVKGGIENPFVNDWKLQSPQGGRFKGWLVKLLEAGQVTPEEIPYLLQLNGAEAWALTAALHDQPVQPDSIASSLV